MVLGIISGMARKRIVKKQMTLISQTRTKRDSSDTKTLVGRRGTTAELGRSSNAVKFWGLLTPMKVNHVV